MATLKSIKNKYLTASDGTVLGVTTNTENISALSFKLATADSLSKFNMVDGFSDDYNDATGVDASGSTNEIRNSTNNYYSGGAILAYRYWRTQLENSPIAGSYHVEAKVFDAAGEIAGLGSGNQSTGSGTESLNQTYTDWTNTFDGNLATNFLLTNSCAATAWWQLDFGSGTEKALTELRFYVGGGGSPAQWAVQYDSTDTGGTGGTWVKVADLNPTSGDAWNTVTWSAPASYNDMTLVSNAFTAQTAPTTARIILDEESYKGDTTLNTDLKAYASRDNGTTFTQMTLASQATLTDTSTLLMHMDGANDGTVFTDSARPPLTVTKAGTPVTKTAEKKFGTASCYLAGTTDWLKLPASDNWSFAASADFTVECWCKWSTAAAYVGMIASKTETGGVYNGWSLRTDASGGDKILSFNFWNNAGSVTFSCNGTSNIGDGSWHHVAATRASDTVRVFVDGALENSGTYAGAIHGTSSGGYGLQIGMDYLNATGSGPMHGYVDEVRISNVARWDAAFTPPTAAYSGYEGDRQLLSGSVDISGQPSGTNVKYKIETLNQSVSKQTRVYGTSMAWA